jgi:predicted O-methyltransferase YrrM
MEFLPPEINAYTEQHTEAEPALLAELNRETWLKALSPRMLSGHFQGRVLAQFSRLIQPTRILEIGTYTGYATLCLAEGLAVGGRIDTIDIDPETLALAKTYFERSTFSQAIAVHCGNALEIVPKLGTGFDLVFLDADKQNYERYWHLVLPLLNPRAVVLADNVLWSGKVANPAEQDDETEGLRRFTRAVLANSDFTTVLVPIRDGILWTQKKS